MPEIDQEDQQSSLATTSRDSNGKLLPGSKLNPTGENGLKGIQRPADRIAYLSTRYTHDEILAFAESRYLRSKLPYWDSVYVMWMARALDPDLTKTKAGTDDLRGERKELLDRLHGQTKASTELTGPGGNPLLPLIKIVFEGNNNSDSLATAEAPVTIDQKPLQVAQEPSSPSDSSIQQINVEFE